MRFFREDVRSPNLYAGDFPQHAKAPPISASVFADGFESGNLGAWSSAQGF